MNQLEFELPPNYLLFSNLSYTGNKMIDQENFMNSVAVVIVSAIVLGHLFY